MAYVGKNPNLTSTVLDNQGVGAVSNPPTGKLKVINRNGVLTTRDDAGSEASLASSSPATAAVAGIIKADNAEFLTPGATLTLTLEAGRSHHLTPSGACVITVPSTALLGQVVEIITEHTDLITIQSSGANQIAILGDSSTISASGRIKLAATQDTPTTAAHWKVLEIEESGKYLPAISSAHANYGTVTVSGSEASYNRVFDTCSIAVVFSHTATPSQPNGFSFSLPIATTTTTTSDLVGTGIGDYTGSGEYVLSPSGSLGRVVKANTAASATGGIRATCVYVIK